MLRALRLLLVASVVALVFALVVGALGDLLRVGELAILLPIAAAGVCVAGLPALLRTVDRALRLVAHDAGRTRYSALAETAARVRAGSLDQAMPGLARVLAEGTGAARSVIWLAVGDRLVSAAEYPVTGGHGASVDGLAQLLTRPDTDHVVPVLDGRELRAALAVSKSDHPLTSSDRTLMQDVANGAAMLLHGVALNAELAERVRRADELAAQLAASRERLTHAREVERRRLIGELSSVTTDRMAALHDRFDEAAGALSEEEVADDPDFATEAAQHSLERARTALDELLERFRVIARGVYPTVLRDKGPFNALDEVAADLPRPVRLSGDLDHRLAWEVESSIYYLAASAMAQLAADRGGPPLRVTLEHSEGLLAVRIDDPAPPMPAEDIRAGLVDHIERLIALGGDLDLAERDSGALELRAWMPSELEPAVAGVSRARRVLDAGLG